MSGNKISRRQLLASAAGTGLALATPSAVFAGAEAAPPAETVPHDPKEALQRLIAGNKRFVAAESIHGHTTSEWRKELVAGQQPFAAILGCATRASFPS